jgi:hypothetical protein
MACGDFAGRKIGGRAFIRPAAGCVIKLFGSILRLSQLKLLVQFLTVFNVCSAAPGIIYSI